MFNPDLLITTTEIPDIETTTAEENTETPTTVSSIGEDPNLTVSVIIAEITKNNGTEVIDKVGDPISSIQVEIPKNVSSFGPAPVGGADPIAPEDIVSVSEEGQIGCEKDEMPIGIYQIETNMGGDVFMKHFLIVIL